MLTVINNGCCYYLLLLLLLFALPPLPLPPPVATPPAAPLARPAPAVALATARRDFPACSSIVGTPPPPTVSLLLLSIISSGLSSFSFVEMSRSSGAAAGALPPCGVTSSAPFPRTASRTSPLSADPPGFSTFSQMSRHADGSCTKHTL